MTQNIEEIVNKIYPVTTFHSNEFVGEALRNKREELRQALTQTHNNALEEVEEVVRGFSKEISKIIKGVSYCKHGNRIDFNCGGCEIDVIKAIKDKQL